MALAITGIQRELHHRCGHPCRLRSPGRTASFDLDAVCEHRDGWGLFRDRPPDWDQGDEWVATLHHIAKEGRVFVIGVATLLRGSDVPDDVPGRELWGGDDDWMNAGIRRS